MKSSNASPTRSYLTKRLVPAMLAAFLLSLNAVSSVRAEGSNQGNRGNPGVVPPQAHPYGKTLAQWSAAWWQWVFSIPADHNPLVDETGADAGQNQSGPVWFLAGNTGGSPTVRTVTVPSGKALLLPILNTAYFGFPCDDRNLPGCEVDQALEESNDITTLLSFIDPAMDGAKLACEIDGRPVGDLPAYRVESSALYSVSAVEGNVFGYPAGPYHPCVDTGYYLMLEPLSSGNHTLYFRGANADASFVVDVTYHFTIKGQ